MVPTMQGVDWHIWHNAYGDAESGLSHRLMLVQECVRRTLDEFSPGPIRVVSICAGQDHDLLGVLTQHSRRTDVAALLVEIDSRNVAPLASASFTTLTRETPAKPKDEKLEKRQHETRGRSNNFSPCCLTPLRSARDQRTTPTCRTNWVPTNALLPTGRV